MSGRVADCVYSRAVYYGDILHVLYRDRPNSVILLDTHGRDLILLSDSLSDQQQCQQWTCSGHETGRELFVISPSVSQCIHDIGPNQRECSNVIML